MFHHIAGALGVAIADGLVRVIDLTMDGAAVTETGRAALQAAGIPLGAGRQSKRVYCRLCLDWSERRPHSPVNSVAALLDRAMTTGPVRRRKGCRVLDVADGGEIDVLCRLSFSEVTRRSFPRPEE